MSRRESSSALERLFQKYYMSDPPLELPADMELREFAYQPFGSKSYVRHLAFQNKSMLLEELKRRIPLHLYYSSARYQYPEAPNMDDKGWLGSDLIFDIDADHLAGCSTLKLRFCPVCGTVVEQGYRGETCPSCGSPLTDLVMVPGECVEKAAGETFKLVQRLREELGLKPATYFSGHRGFHVHVSCSDQCSMLDSGHRREIVDYLKGAGLDPSIVASIQAGRGFIAASPQPGDPGWRGLIGRTIKEVCPDAKRLRDVLEKMGGDLERLVGIAVEEWGISVDEKVTIDTKRLVRIPGSLHGKTGLKVVKISEDSLAGFKLDLEDYAAFRGEIRVKPLLSISLEIPGGGEVELSRGEVLKMEAHKAVYLAAKGIVELLSIEEAEII